MAVSVRSSSVDELFLPDIFAVDHGLDRRSTATYFALMRAFVVVVLQPLIEIGLQRFDGFIEFFAERDLIKLLQDRLVESFTDVIRLRRFHLGLGMVDVVDRQKQLKIMLVGPSAIFSSPVGQNPQHR